MALRRLQVTDFRCLQAAAFELDPRFTLISGPNGSGKTSLLEAIYLLGRGRSFRTRRLEHLIRFGATRFVVFGELAQGERHVGIGVEGSRGGIQARVGGHDAASLAELALEFPVQIIDPEVHKLIEEGPTRRRRYLDWGVFHVEPSFVGQWQRYRQVLQQRNASLRSGQSRDQTAAWNHDLIRYGLEISGARCRYVEVLAAVATAICRRLLGRELSLSYRPGWPQDLSFAEGLARAWPLDQQRASTQVGPHRAELVVRLDGVLARDHVSRGQQKLLAAALLIAQIQLFPASATIRPSLLLDDPAAELDDQRLIALIGEVAAQSTPLIVTTLNPGFTAFGVPGAHIQIDQGRVKPL